MWTSDETMNYWAPKNTTNSCRNGTNTMIQRHINHGTDITTDDVSAHGIEQTSQITILSSTHEITTDWSMIAPHRQNQTRSMICKP